jgi:hypothetical protein
LVQFGFGSAHRFASSILTLIVKKRYLDWCRVRWL